MFVCITFPILSPECVSCSIVDQTYLPALFRVVLPTRVLTIKADVQRHHDIIPV
jgi:hypothetical protein